MTFSPKLLQLILGALQTAPAIISEVSKTIHSNESKADKALNTVTSVVRGLDAVSPETLSNPAVQAALKQMNDAIYQAAKLTAAVQAGHVPAAPKAPLVKGQ